MRSNGIRFFVFFVMIMALLCSCQDLFNLYDVEDKAYEDMIPMLEDKKWSIALDNDSLLIEKGKKDRIIAKVLVNGENSDHSVTWSSDNEFVATVDKTGVVTATGAGFCIITASYGLIKATCFVHVFSKQVPPEYVDLGLSVNWATFNVGASVPEEAGDYFAWGEVETKYDFNWGTYIWCKGSENTLTKYCNNIEYGYNGFSDDKTVLDLEDDVAHVKWGDDWRMPTIKEIDELIRNCSYKWTTQNGVYGCRLTSLKPGFTDRSIFLPAAGRKSYNSIYNNGINGLYRSSSLNTEETDESLLLYFGEQYRNTNSSFDRCEGSLVRPVRPVVNSNTVSEDTPPDNEIWYTSTDGGVVDPNSTNVFGSSFVSNTYNNEKGVITFDGPVTQIGTDAFKMCSRLQSISLPNTCMTIEDDAFHDCSSLKEILLPVTLQSLGKMSLYGCKSLEKISLPEGLRIIEEYALCGCVLLHEVSIPEAVGFIDGGAFAACKGLECFKGKFASDDGRMLLDVDKLIAVAPLGLTIFTVPDGIKTINAGVFSSCENLESINLPEGLLYIGSQAFSNCNKLTELIIPESVQTMEAEAFRYCYNLSYIKLPSSTTKLSWGLVHGCSSLQSIDIPNSVTVIGTQAISYCRSLKSIVFPENVTSVGTYALSNCVNLEYIEFLSETVPTGGDNMFVETNNCPIYVPAGSEIAYKTAPKWSTYASRITASPVSHATYRYVDLGLSVKWATCNVGATSPEEYGDYFAWGETEPYYEPGYAQEDPQTYWKYGKSGGYNWSNNKYIDWYSGFIELYKYNSRSAFGAIDDKNQLEPDDDVAHVNWGGDWLMPTSEQFRELLDKDNCSWTWTNINGVYGFVVKSKKKGYTNNSIFLPAAGYRNNTDLIGLGKYGFYGASSLMDNPVQNYGIMFASDDHQIAAGSRAEGLSVRPVCP